jgi:hypothetical protein
LGAGNNITLRIAVMRGRVAIPEIDGEQHLTFDDTLPRSGSRSAPRPSVPRSVGE